MQGAKIILFNYVETRKSYGKVQLIIKCMYTTFVAPLHNYERHLSYTRECSREMATTVVSLEQKIVYIDLF